MNKLSLLRELSQLRTELNKFEEELCSSKPMTENYRLYQIACARKLQLCVAALQKKLDIS